MVKKTILKIIGVVFLLFVVLVALRFLVGGDEDTWICVDGEWVKHGVPAAPKPQTGCGDKSKTIQATPTPVTPASAETVAPRLKILRDGLHGFGSGTEAKELFPDLSVVYVDDGHGNTQIPQEILPFTYFYSQEADITVSICEVDQTVFICPGKLARLIETGDFDNCQVAGEYLQLED